MILKTINNLHYLATIYYNTSKLRNYYFALSARYHYISMLLNRFQTAMLKYQTDNL